jgi:hypothetical protein
MASEADAVGQLLSIARDGDVPALETRIRKDPDFHRILKANLSQCVLVAAVRDRALVVERACQLCGTTPAAVLTREAFFVACRHGSIAFVDLCVPKAGMSVNSRNGVGASPLYFACANGHAALARSLIRLGAHIPQPVMNGWRPLRAALEFRHPRCVQVLVSAGARLNEEFLDSSTPLVLACRLGDVASTDLLLRGGAKPGLVTSAGNNALLAACQCGKVELVRLLLRFGAPPAMATAPFRRGVTPELLPLLDASAKEYSAEVWNELLLAEPPSRLPRDPAFVERLPEALQYDISLRFGGDIVRYHNSGRRVRLRSMLVAWYHSASSH